MRVAKMEAYTRAGILRYLGGKDFKEIGHNTYAYEEDGNVGIRYHNTTIVRLFTDGTMMLNNSGWHTSTTSGRMHDFSMENGGGRVGIKNGTMLYYPPLGGAPVKITSPIHVDLTTGEVIKH